MIRPPKRPSGMEKVQSCIETRCSQLNLDGLSLADYGVLNDMDHLRVLMISFTDFADLTNISNLTELT